MNTQSLSLEKSVAHFLDYFINSFLAGEENGCRQYALNELISNSLVKAREAFFLNYCHDAIEGGLVPHRIRVTRLKATFNYTDKKWLMLSNRIGCKFTHI
jgi:hypothetical protein